MAECAALARDLVQTSGLTARLYPTARHQMVFAEWGGVAGAPTVLIYGHFEVERFHAGVRTAAALLAELAATA